MTLKEKWHGWLRVQLSPDEDKIDVLGFALAIATGILLFYATVLFCFEALTLHKFVYYGCHSWQMPLKRPDMLLVLSPVLNFPLLILRALSHDVQAYRKWTLAAASVVLVSAVILLVGSRLFFAFQETLP